MNASSNTIFPVTCIPKAAAAAAAVAVIRITEKSSEAHLCFWHVPQVLLFIIS